MPYSEQEHVTIVVVEPVEAWKHGVVEGEAYGEPAGWSDSGDSGVSDGMAPLPVTLSWPGCGVLMFWQLGEAWVQAPTHADPCSVRGLGRPLTGGRRPLHASRRCTEGALAAPGRVAHPHAGLQFGRPGELFGGLRSGEGWGGRGVPPPVSASCTA